MPLVRSCLTRNRGDEAAPSRLTGSANIPIAHGKFFSHDGKNETKFGGGNMPVVRITLIAGRSPEQKRKAAEAVTQALAEHLNSTPSQTQVIFEDVSSENWAIEGKLISDTRKK
jgi:4-oxalocrotonate tautomerase